MATKILGSQASCVQHCFRRETPAKSASPKSSHVNHGSYSGCQRIQSLIPFQSKKHQDRYLNRLYDQYPGPNLVMGQVKILKRGMKFSFDDDGFLAADDSNENDNAESKIEKGLDLTLELTDRSGWNHNNENLIAEAKIKKCREVINSKVQKYVGSSFHVSPSPSLVPTPQFQSPMFY